LNRSKRNIVWIVSYPKSGNTWFRTVLANLLSDGDNPVDINELDLSPIASSRLHFDEYSGVSSSDLSFEEIEGIQAETYRELSYETEGLLFRKVHDIWKRNKDGREIFPADVTKAVIYIIRNPLDIVISYAFHSNRSFEEIVAQMNDIDMGLCNKPGKLFNQLKQELGNWSMHVKSWTEDSGLPVHIVKYEDLLNDPEKSFRKAFQFSGIQFNPVQLQKAIEFSSFEKLSENEIRSGFKEKPIKMEKFFRSGVAGQGKELLSPEVVIQLKEIHQEMMRKFGYVT